LGLFGSIDFDSASPYWAAAETSDMKRHDAYDDGMDVLRERNGATLMRVSFLISLSVCVATMLPAEQIGPAVSLMLLTFSLAPVLAAAAAGVAPWARHLTFWDEAAMLVLLSFVTRWINGGTVTAIVAEHITLLG